MSKRVEDLTDRELDYWLLEAERKEREEEMRIEREQRRLLALMKIKAIYGDTVPTLNHKEH